MTIAILLIFAVLTMACLAFFVDFALGKIVPRLNSPGAKINFAARKAKPLAVAFLALAMIFAPASPAVAQTFDCYSKGDLGALGRGLLENTQWGIHGVPAGNYGSSPIPVTTAYVSGTSTVLNGLPPKGTRRFTVTWDESARQIIGVGVGSDNVRFTVNLTSPTSTAELRSGGWLHLVRRTAVNPASSPLTETYDAVFRASAAPSTHSPCPQSGGGGGGGGGGNNIGVIAGGAVVLLGAVWWLSGDKPAESFTLSPHFSYRNGEDGGMARYGARLDFRPTEFPGAIWWEMSDARAGEAHLSVGAEWAATGWHLQAEANAQGESIDYRLNAKAERQFGDWRMWSGASVSDSLLGAWRPSVSLGVERNLGGWMLRADALSNPNPLNRTHLNIRTERIF